MLYGYTTERIIALLNVPRFSVIQDGNHVYHLYSLLEVKLLLGNPALEADKHQLTQMHMMEYFLDTMGRHAISNTMI